MNCNCTYCKQAAELGKKAAATQHKAQYGGNPSFYHESAQRVYPFCKQARATFDAAYKAEMAEYEQPPAYYR